MAAGGGGVKMAISGEMKTAASAINIWRNRGVSDQPAAKSKKIEGVMAAKMA
jgi:hypothetical protein